MLEPQERTLLNGFYKNASVGADATVNILDKVTHPDLREELCTQLEYYRKQKQEICRQMQEAYAMPQEQGAMAKFCANVSLQMRLWEIRATATSPNRCWRAPTWASFSSHSSCTAVPMCRKSSGGRAAKLYAGKRRTWSA